MSMFQCQVCGCAENTALTACGHAGLNDDCMDWSEHPERRGKALCSACAPGKHSDGTECDDGGQWHGQFDRIFLAPGEWATNKQGNLEHHTTGATNYRDFQIQGPSQ